PHLRAADGDSSSALWSRSGLELSGPGPQAFQAFPLTLQRAAPYPGTPPGLDCIIRYSVREQEKSRLTHGRFSLQRPSAVFSKYFLIGSLLRSGTASRGTSSALGWEALAVFLVSAAGSC